MLEHRGKFYANRTKRMVLAFCFLCVVLFPLFGFLAYKIPDELTRDPWLVIPAGLLLFVISLWIVVRASNDPYHYFLYKELEVFNQEHGTHFTFKRTYLKDFFLVILAQSPIVVAVFLINYFEVSEALKGIIIAVCVTAMFTAFSFFMRQYTKKSKWQQENVFDYMNQTLEKTAIESDDFDVSYVGMGVHSKQSVKGLFKGREVNFNFTGSAYKMSQGTSSSIDIRCSFNLKKGGVNHIEIKECKNFWKAKQPQGLESTFHNRFEFIEGNSSQISSALKEHLMKAWFSGAFEIQQGKLLYSGVENASIPHMSPYGLILFFEFMSTACDLIESD